MRSTTENGYCQSYYIVLYPYMTRAANISSVCSLSGQPVSWAALCLHITGKQRHLVGVLHILGYKVVTGTWVVQENGHLSQSFSAHH